MKSLPNSRTFDYQSDFSDLSGGTIVSQNENSRVTEYDLGDGRIVRKTESLVDEELLDMNRQMMNDNQNARWGDGQIVASIPLNVFYDRLAPAVKEGNHGYIKKWLNDFDNKMYRTFPGRI